MVNFDIFTLIGISSLVLQLAVLVLLVYGYQLKRKLKFKRHGTVMGTAALLHLALVLAIMIPAFVFAVVPDYIVASPLMPVSLVGLIHGILGSIAVALGVWLVSAWRFRKDFTACFNRKKLMLITFTVWISALVFGIILFAFFYGPALIVKS